MSNKVIRRAFSLLAVLPSVAGAGWLLLPGLGPEAASWATLSGADGHREPRVEDAVVVLCGATLAAVAAWWALGVLVCVVAAVRDGTGALDRGGILRPWLARVLVSTVVGALVATTSGADAGGGGRGTPAPPGRLDGLAVPERPYGGIRTHRVVLGESLWSITSGLLAAGAAEHTVARTWPRLHRLNRDRVGPDPDLIRPGTTLRLPAWAPAPTRGAAR